MAKYWTSGQVKTRLGQSIGDRQAAAIHRHFVIHLATSLRSVADRRVFAVAPVERMSDFAAALPTGADGKKTWDIMSQGSGDLGRRIEHWFRHSLRPLDEESQQICSVLIGADCPTLWDTEIDVAFQQLNSSDVVLGPASDGGYYLIGLSGPWRQEHQHLFEDIPWSSTQVLDVTIGRIEETGLRMATLQTREDIDTINELNRLREELDESRPHQTRDQDLATAIESILGESKT